MYINWKKTVFVALDIVLAAYIVLAVTSFNRPDRSGINCTRVQITIADKDSSGFLSALEVKRLLTEKGLYPKGKKLDDINLRAIENTLKANTFIDNVQCYKTEDGNVGITVTQRLPLLRVKTDSEDYYLDTECELWKNQVEQINILPDKNMELVTRIGQHIVCLGRLPENNDKTRRERAIKRFIDFKLARLDKFYQYGLNQVGWNKYDYIDMEFDNQVICRKSKHKHNEAAEQEEEL